MEQQKEKSAGYIKDYLESLGLRGKLFVFLSFIGILLISLLLFNIFSLYRVANFSETITESGISSAEAVQVSLASILEANINFEKALVITDQTDIVRFDSHEDKVNDLVILVESLLAALTWGSESEIFKNVDGGIHYNEWQKRNLGEKFILLPPSSEISQSAGSASIFFGGFAVNVRETLKLHRRNLMSGDETEELVKEATFHRKALDLSESTIGQFLIMAENVNEMITRQTVEIQETQQKAIFNTFIFSLSGFTLMVGVGYVFTNRSIISPIHTLTLAATRMGKGDFSLKVPIRSDDEMGVLAEAFNSMSETVGRQTSDIVKRLKSIVNEQDVSGKMLIRRDFELRKANDELKDLDEQKSKFLSVAAHQLRTPLSASKWALKMVLDGDLGPLTVDQKTVLMKGYESNERMINLVNNLLDVDRISSGRYQYVYEPMSIIDQIDSVLADLIPTIKKKNMKVVFNKKEVPMVLADSKKMRNVVQNLIDNAVKYTPPNGTIFVSVEPVGDDMLAVAIKDTGIGIPKNQQDQIFQKFFRGDNARKLETDGSGLGMFIAREIVLMHKGKLWFESKEDKGSTFTFTLPTVQDENT